MALNVNEIFFSIQGESVNAGRPCVFIRLSGCNLRCSYCDTRYAYDEGFEMEIDDILDEVHHYKCPLVEVTGGEPLIQDETPLLIYRLLGDGREVMLETNGSRDISVVDVRCMRIVDVKCPTSNESHKNDLKNLKRLQPRDQVKFVIGSREDYVYAREISKFRSPGFKKSNILFSPVHGRLAPEALTEWILEDRLTVRLHVQLHKIIWPEADRGV